MKKAIEITTSGIKCDNPVCDFHDPSIKLRDYKRWLNKPCPLCGMNLLTKQDYDAVMFLHRAVMVINFIFAPLYPLWRHSKRVRGKFRANGIGNLYCEMDGDPDG